MICVIPARASSSRLPGKNLLPLGGRPLVSWITRSAVQSGLFRRVLVCTDSLEIAAVCAAEGALHVERPPELCTGEEGAPAVVRHAVLDQGVPPGELVCMSFPTAPFTAPEDFKRAAALYEAREPEVSLTVTEVAQPPEWCGTLDGVWFRMRGSVAAGMAVTEYVPTFGVYMAQAVRFMTEDRDRGFGDWTRCAAVVVPRDRGVDIDDGPDYLYAQWVCERDAALQR